MATLGDIPGKHEQLRILGKRVHPVKRVVIGIPFRKSYFVRGNKKRSFLPKLRRLDLDEEILSVFIEGTNVESLAVTPSDRHMLDAIGEFLSVQ